MLNPEMARRLVRYAVVGVAVMLFFTGMNWALGHFMGRYASFLLAYPPALGLHFLLNKHWTFGCKRTDAARQVSEYALMAFSTFLVQAAVFAAVTHLTNLPGWVAAAISNAAQMLITFLVMQYRIFRPGAEASKALP